MILAKTAPTYQVKFSFARSSRNPSLSLTASFQMTDADAVRRWLDSATDPDIEAQSPGPHQNTAELAVQKEIHWVILVRPQMCGALYGKPCR